jgi:hypothetical protein
MFKNFKSIICCVVLTVLVSFLQALWARVTLCAAVSAGKTIVGHDAVEAVGCAQGVFAAATAGSTGIRDVGTEAEK